MEILHTSPPTRSQTIRTLLILFCMTFGIFSVFPSCGSPRGPEVPSQPPAQDSEISSTASPITVSVPVSSSVEWTGSKTYIWQTVLGRTDLLPFPSITFHNQTGSEASVCPSGTGKPKKGRVTSNGTGGNCATGWVATGNTGIGVVQLAGYLPHQTDVAYWLCKLSVARGGTTNCDAAVSSGTWAENSRKELWLGYHGPFAYQHAVDSAWHDYFGVPANVPYDLDWKNGCDTTTGYPSCSLSISAAATAPWKGYAFTPISVLYQYQTDNVVLTNGSTLHINESGMPRMICLSAFYRAYPGDTTTAEANCGSIASGGHGPVTDDLANYLRLTYYP